MNENVRIAALQELDILDTPQEKEYDDLVHLASAICDTPISLVSLVDTDRQWFKAVMGLDVRETPRSLSFCAHAIRQPDLFVVEDAAKDKRFLSNALVTDNPHIRFYAGVPLQAPGGEPIGTLCVIDRRPRTLTDGQREALTILGAQVQTRLTLRLKQKALQQAHEANQELCHSLQATNDLFLSFMSHGPFASYIKEADGSMVFYNKYLAEASGVDEQAWIGLKDEEIWPAEMAAKFRQDDIAVLAGEEAVEKDDVSPRADGTAAFWKSLKFPYVGQNGKRMLAGISIDVTREVLHEAELENSLRDKGLLTSQLVASQHMFRSFMENSPNQTFVKDDQGRIVFYNCAVEKFFGIDATEWLDKTAYEILPEAVAARYVSQDHDVLSTGVNVDSVDEMVAADGQVHQFRKIKFSYKDLDGRRMLASVSQDITEETRQARALAQANAKLELLATTDVLTGVSSRRQFGIRAEIEFSNWKRHSQPLTVLLMDVDNFKQRNDSFGHAAGDKALEAIGRVLRRCIRTGDTAARMGGEEFGILLPNTDLKGGMDLAARFQHMLALEEHGPLPLTVSIGVTGAMDSSSKWELLLSQADEAMYVAKRGGKNKAVAYGVGGGKVISMVTQVGLTA